jgi:flagellar biosynthesis protein FlhF
MKKFVVESIQEGWEKINKELGENAIIIDIKEVENKLEIIAAVAVNNKKEKNEIKLIEKLKKEFNSEEDVSKLKNILDFVISLKNKNENKINTVERHLKENFQNYIDADTKKLIESKILNEKLLKKYITVLGGIATGKTTTIAKIASILKFNLGKKIAIASFDFYKIGGFDSLKKFAEIMQIPFFPIKDEKEIISYKDGLELYDHIIFDTPGNIFELKEIEKLVSFITNSINSENILTISLDKKENIIREEINYFSKFNISHAVLTKYDTLTDKEDLFITLSNIPFKVSFVSTGLKVPSDIVDFSEFLTHIEVSK